MSEPVELPPEIEAEIALFPKGERPLARKLAEVAPDHPNLLRTLQQLRVDGFVITLLGSIEAQGRRK